MYLPIRLVSARNAIFELTWKKNPSPSLLIAHNYVASATTSVYFGSARSLDITSPSDMTLLMCVSQRLIHSILRADVTLRAVVDEIEDHEEGVKTCWWLVAWTFHVWSLYANVRLSGLRSNLHALNYHVFLSCIEEMKHWTSLLQPVLQFYHLAIAPPPPKSRVRATLHIKLVTGGCCMQHPWQSLARVFISIAFFYYNYLFH